MNSLDTRFSKNVFEAVQKTRSTCFIKHSCSFFKHYIRNCNDHSELNYEISSVPLKTFFTSTTVRFLDIINTALAWQLGVLLEHSSISKTNN